jgi:hypothetical protein
MNIFYKDLKLSSFFKMKDKICKESDFFYKFLFITNILIFFEATLTDFHNKLQKTSFKNSFIWKNYLGGGGGGGG